MDDLRHALKSLLRARSLSATATLILALGIGMAAATYAVYDTVLVQALPVTDADHLGACVLLLAVAVLAMLLPAEQVTRIDPATALRS